MMSAEETGITKRPSIIRSVIKDKKYRNKFIRTLCILFSYTTLGFFYGNLGPALPDIQLLIGQSLDVMSWLFTATYGGSLIGTLICGPVCDRVGPQLVLFVSVFMASILTGVFIYSPNFASMLVVRVFTGMFIGGVDIGGIASVAELWQADARPYMHALQCVISVGGIVTPFIIQPFLAPRTQMLTTEESSHTSSDKVPSTSNFSNYSTSLDILFRNTSFKNVTLSSLPAEIFYHANSSDCLNTSKCRIKDMFTMTVQGQTRIQYAFIIFAVTGVAASFSLFVFVLSDCRNKDKVTKRATRKEVTGINRTRYSLDTNIKYTLLGIIAVQSYLTAALGLKVFALLPSFFVIEFMWSTSQASVGVSAFWIGKAVFRFLGIFLSLKMKQSVLIPLFSVIYIISAVCLTVAAIYHINPLAWVFTVAMGVGFSVLRSALFSMTEEKIAHVSGKIASLYLVFFVLGGMLDPLYTGYLMDDVSPMWFTYVLVIESGLFLLLFALAKVLLFKYGKKQEIGMEIKIEIEPMATTKLTS